MNAIDGHRNLMSLVRQPLWTWLIITGSVIATVILTILFNAGRLDRDAALAAALFLVSPIVAWRVICRQNIALRTHLPELFEDSDRQVDRVRPILTSGLVAGSSEETTRASRGLKLLPKRTSIYVGSSDTTAVHGRTERSIARQFRREREMREAKLLLQAIDSSWSAVIQLRSLLVVQIPRRDSVEKQIVAVSLSKRQREFLREHPHILERPPERILEELPRPRRDAESD